MLRGEDYYLAPEEGGEKAFTLIFKICEQLGLGLLLKQVIREKERLIFIRVVGGAVVLSYLYFPEEIRSPPSLPAVQLNQKEMELAIDLIKQLIEEIDWKEIKNETAIWLKQLIEVKLQGIPIEAKPKVEVKEEQGLLEALQVMVQKRKKKAEEEGK
jgi:DNA end-binding protein Ku